MDFCIILSDLFLEVLDVSLKQGINGQLLMAIKLLYCQPEVCVNGKQSKSFHVVLVLGKGVFYHLSFFLIYINWMDKLNRIDCVMIGKCKISRLLIANDLVLLASSKSGLQHALNGFVAARYIAGIKISTSKTEELHASRNPLEQKLLKLRKVKPSFGISMIA